MDLKGEYITIRTNVVKLETIKAFAYRQKLQAGDSAIVIVRPDVKQPGMATISKKTGEPVPSANTPVKRYPAEAFKEAMALTNGMLYKKQGSIKVTEEMFVEPEEEKEPEVITLNEAAYRKIVEHYTDKNGKLSYDLVNSELIKFMKSSSIVRKMIADGEKASDIRDYIVLNKLRNIAGDLDMKEEEVFMIVDLLDEVSPKGLFKELNVEIRSALAKNKAK